MPNREGEVVVALRNVSFAYDHDVVLSDLTMEVVRGSFLGVVGPSGSGKTTMLRLLGGGLTPSTGSVEASPSFRIGYVPQVDTVNWYFPVTVEEVVLMGSRSTRRFGFGYGTDERKRAHGLLHDLGIGHLEPRHIRELSGGQQQRVFVARALMADPNLVLLDEPMAGVDVKTRQDVLATLRVISEKGVAVVLTTHDLNSVAAHLPEVMCINGRLIAQGPPASTLVPDVLFETFGAEMELIEHHGHPIVIDKHPDPLLPPTASRADGISG